jgi:hypothetical protein
MTGARRNPRNWELCSTSITMKEEMCPFLKYKM